MRLVAKGRTLSRDGERESELADDRVEERHPRFQGVSHACSVCLHEHVVDEEDPEVDVHDSRQLVRPLAFRVTTAEQLQGIELPAAVVLEEVRPSAGPENTFDA